jgi:hypothetical protein
VHALDRSATVTGKVLLRKTVFKDSKLDWVTCRITSSGGLV